MQSHVRKQTGKELYWPNAMILVCSHLVLSTNRNIYKAAHRMELKLVVLVWNHHAGRSAASRIRLYFHTTEGHIYPKDALSVAASKTRYLAI